MAKKQPGWVDDFASFIPFLEAFDVAAGNIPVRSINYQVHVGTS